MRTASSPSDGDLRCGICLTQVRNEEGIWTALSPQRREYFRKFVDEYQQVRAAEGRGSHNDAYYLALPFRDLSGRNQQQWSIRSRTYNYLQRYILPRLERVTPTLDVLDLGAGNGWLDYRLALRGHRPAAVDLLTNVADGLGAASRYFQYLQNPFARFQAEFSRLPFSDSQFDCAIFNASFHYAEDYEQTLGEAIRCLRPGGWIVIADSPWYQKEESGEQMLSERRQHFTSQYGFPSDSITSQEYLTDARLDRLAKRFELKWEMHRPYYGLRWSLRPLVARMKRKRQPSEFRIYMARVNFS
jgi:SAM-dependent methyltransferase